MLFYFVSSKATELQNEKENKSTKTSKFKTKTRTMSLRQKQKVTKKLFLIQFQLISYYDDEAIDYQIVFLL